MRTDSRELRDWFIITVIILIGFLCLIVAGSMAVRFAPSWQLSSSMDSLLDPDSDYLTSRPRGYIEPVDQAILTPAAWIGIFQTPGASIPQRTPVPTRTAIPTNTSTFAVGRTATVPPAAISSPTSTIAYLPGSPTETSKAPPPTATVKPTKTQPVFVSVDADLQITKSDGVLMYAAGQLLTYSIIVTNHGPSDVTGAVITDHLPVQIESWSWDCTSQNSGASGCDPAASSNTSFSDTVDLPNGASIVYTVAAQVLAKADGELVNLAEVAVPAANTDTNPGNNLAQDTDQFLGASILPTGRIGETKDGLTEVVTPGSSTTLMFSTPLLVNGHGGYDLVFYERLNGMGIAMDVVVLEISDGNKWYPVFYWGDDIADTNSNLNIAVVGGVENDNRDFTTQPASDILFNTTGILIELDGIVPPGTYPYIRIVSPPTGSYPFGVDLDGGCEVDAIVIVQ